MPSPSMTASGPSTVFARFAFSKPWVRRTALALNLAGVLAALALVWGPELAAYHVPTPSLDDATIGKVLREADDAVLREVGRQRTGLPVVPMSTPAADRENTVRAAERLLGGQVHFPKQSLVNIRIPFDERNLDEGLLTHQLFVAGLVGAVLHDPIDDRAARLQHEIGRALAVDVAARNLAQ